MRQIIARLVLESEGRMLRFATTLAKNPLEIRKRYTKYISTYVGEPTWLAKRTPDLLFY